MFDLHFTREPAQAYHKDEQSAMNPTSAVRPEKKPRWAILGIDELWRRQYERHGQRGARGESRDLA
jgi:hypothetical protein